MALSLRQAATPPHPDLLPASGEKEANAGLSANEIQGYNRAAAEEEWAWNWG